MNNYQKEMEKIIEGIERKEDGSRPTLLLHTCCAPCSSYPLEYLSSIFKITVFYYNPNITDKVEYERRVEEQKRLIEAYNLEKGTDIAFEKISFIEGDYEPFLFTESVKGLENCREGGERCKVCFELRLSKSAKLAAANKFDFFTTSLTISPLKNAELLNEIGQKTAAEEGTSFLPSDFKKKNGYKRSIELSREYNLYRQDYCGCIYSKIEMENIRKTNRLENKENEEAD